MIRQFLVQPYLYVFITLIGIAFKFYHLDSKLFWLDEIYTIQHTSGIPDRDYPALVPVNEIKNIGFYKDLYHLNTQQRTIASELKGLLNSTQLNPLHYPLLMVWYRIVGDNPIDFRSFGVVIFILTLPFLFLLSQSLFDSKLAGWIAVSLYAVSPYIHLYAQEARYYILWSFVLVVLHYLLLQGIRNDNLKWWSAYAIMVAISLYASPVSGIAIFGHMIFVCLTRKDLRKACIISILSGLILYLPWALMLFYHLDKISSALSWHSNSQQQIAFWFPLLGQSFYLFSIFSSTLDFFYVFDQPSTALPPEVTSAFILNFAVLVLILIAFVFLLTKTRRDTKYFLLLAILPGLIFFYSLDLLRNGMTSWWWRYFMFTATGVILVMTNFLSKNTERGSLRYSFMFVALAAIGILSMRSISQARHWFLGKTWDVCIEDARFLSNARNPLVISDFGYKHGMIDFMVVMLECHSDSIDVLRASPDIDNVEGMVRHKTYSDIFVYHGSGELVDNLKSQFGARMDSLDVEGTSSMWRINVDSRADLQ